MPPTKKQPTEESTPALPVGNDYEMKKGDFVHLVTIGGAKYKSSEVLGIGSSGITIRSSLLGPTQSEVTFVPWTSIDGIGLIGKR